MVARRERTNLVWHHLYLSGIDTYGQIMGQIGSWSVYVPTPAQNNSTISFIGSGSGTAALNPGAAPQGTLVNGIALQTARLCAGPYGVAVKPEDVWQMDIKIDDGLPTTGNIVAWDGRIIGTCGTPVSGAAACLTGVAPNYTYNFTNTDDACDYLFMLMKG